MVLRVRKDGQVRPQSALIAIGVNTNGYREVLGFRIGDSSARRMLERVIGNFGRKAPRAVNTLEEGFDVTRSRS